MMKQKKSVPAVERGKFAGREPLASPLANSRLRELVSAVDRCSNVIDSPGSSDLQRQEAHLARGKALVSLGQLSAAAFDFYKVLEADHNHSEAFSYILQIEADTGLQLTNL